MLSRASRMTSQKQHFEEVVSCRACGQHSRLLLRARDLNRMASEDRFAYYSCGVCGVVQVFPIPLDLETYYDKKHWYYSVPGSIDELRAQGQGFKPRLSVIQRFTTTGKLLDVGASHGTFVYLAQQNGYEVEAVEMDPASCRYMQNMGIRAICATTLESAESMLGVYDVITLYHVIEHLEDPSTALRVLARHLSPHGILVISTPNPNSLQFKMLGRFWVNLDAPRHLSLIPLAVLTEDAARNGLELAWASSSDPESLSFSKWSWEASITNVLLSTGMMPALGIRSMMAERKKGSFMKLFVLARRLICRASAIGLAWLLNLVLAPFERSTDRGSSYSAVFRRRDCVAPKGT
jgi:2-polyprenyl-3-methyl-5-hydroxy-6-metoxy-1,4-benzoquinol methylase